MTTSYNDYMFGCAVGRVQAAEEIIAVLSNSDDKAKAEVLFEKYYAQFCPDYNLKK